MTEIEMLNQAIKQCLLALRALSELVRTGMISDAQDEAASEEIIRRMAALSSRCNMLVATGTGVTPLPDTTQVEALRDAVTALAAFNAAAGAWGDILATVLSTAKALASGDATTSAASMRSATVAGAALPDRATLALAVAGIALTGALFAAARGQGRR